MYIVWFITFGGGVGSYAVLPKTTNHSKIQCYFVKMLLKTIIYIPYISCISQLIAQASIYLVFLRYQRCISNSQSKKIYDWIYHCSCLNSPAVWATTTEKLHSPTAFLLGGICNTPRSDQTTPKGLSLPIYITVTIQPNIHVLYFYSLIAPTASDLRQGITRLKAY